MNWTSGAIIAIAASGLTMLLGALAKRRPGALAAGRDAVRETGEAARAAAQLFTEINLALRDRTITPDEARACHQAVHRLWSRGMEAVTAARSLFEAGLRSSHQAPAPGNPDRAQDGREDP